MSQGVDIGPNLVRGLIEGQFPQWAELPIEPVPRGGWDNRSFRLGEHMIVRLPSAEAYAAQVLKEQRWLPTLAPVLPVSIPVPIVMGQPGEGYPWNWSVYSWLEGESADVAGIADPALFALPLSGFLQALQRVDTAGAPRPGSHNFQRGGPLARYDAETREAIERLGNQIDGKAAIAAWETSLAAPWHGPPKWLHGDFSPPNLLVCEGKLSAVIDFGCCAAGDPACDLALAWTFFEAKARSAFRSALTLDGDAWLRGRGWALWKALIVLAALPGNDASRRENARFALTQVLADHAQSE